MRKIKYYIPSEPELNKLCERPIFPTCSEDILKIRGFIISRDLQFLCIIFFCNSIY